MIGGAFKAFSCPPLRGNIIQRRHTFRAKKYEFYITWKAGIRAFCPYLCFEAFQIKCSKVLRFE
jgi:hypothetical protein